jgi:hypothetical protein
MERDSISSLAYYSVLPGGVAMLKSCGFLLTLAAVFLFTAVSAKAEPVITIAGAEISPQFPEPRSFTTISVTVQNIGDLITPDNMSLVIDVYSIGEDGYIIEGDRITGIGYASGNIDALDPNQQQIISATIPLEHEGPHIVYANIHADRYTADEIGTFNSQLREIFHVTRPADLIMEGSRLNNDGQLVLTMHNAGAAIPDEYFQASTITVNIGTNTYTQRLATADPTGRLGRPATPIFNNRVSYVWPAGGSDGIVLPVLDRHEVVATVDTNHRINDHRRSNNTRVNHVGGKPDLVVCFREPDSSTAGRFNEYSPFVKNIGNARSRPVNLRFYLENKGGTNHTIPSLPAGGKYYGIDRRVYWAVRGNRIYKLKVDSRDEADELYEYNNRLEGSLCVGPVPPNFSRCGLPDLPQTRCSD